jgi:hypothetical protein
MISPTDLELSVPGIYGLSGKIKLEKFTKSTSNTRPKSFGFFDKFVASFFKLRSITGTAVFGHAAPHAREVV